MDPALGIPRPGPIERYIAVVKTRANFSPTLEDKFLSPSVLPTAIAPRTGKIIAVTEKAKREIKVLFPA